MHTHVEQGYETVAATWKMASCKRRMMTMYMCIYNTQTLANAHNHFIRHNI